MLFWKWLCVGEFQRNTALQDWFYIFLLTVTLRSFLQKTSEKLKVRKIETLLFGGLVKIILFRLEDILYGYLKNYLKKTL